MKPLALSGGADTEAMDYSVGSSQWPQPLDRHCSHQHSICICSDAQQQKKKKKKAKGRLISELSNQPTVQTKHEADIGIFEDMYKARTKFNNYCVKKKCLQRVHE